MGRMTEVAAARRTTGRVARPTWWWFLLHGVLVAVFGVVALATPFDGAGGYLVDGFVFGVLCFVVGWQIVIQAWQSRTFARGWGVLFAVGVHAAGAAVAFCVLAVLGMPYALFWSVIGFLMVEGCLLAIGLLWSPLYRMWGILMGTCLFLAALIMMIAWLADPSHSFDIPDTGMGIASLLYGCAVFVAALQARAADVGRG